MAQSPKQFVRKILSGPMLKLIENEYRLARASYANARFKWPAKDMRVIMITGTNGKTTTAHFLFSILRRAGYSVGLSSTAELRINDQVEINDTNMTVLDPIKLRRQLAQFRDKRVDFVILEATSQSLDQHRLFGIPCEVAIFTNLTQDHLDYHKTMKGYAKAKSLLWDLKPKISVLNRDDDWFAYFAKKATGKILTYGLYQTDVTVSGYKPVGDKAQFKLGLADGASMISLNLPGKYNAYNAAAAATAASALGVASEVIEEGIEALESLTGRMQPVEASGGYKVYVDYAHTPDGLEKLLRAARDFTPNNIWLVFGACGDRDRVKRPIMGKIASKLADRIVLTDEESYSEDPQIIRDEIREGMKGSRNYEKKVVEFADRRDGIKYALDHAKKGDTILVTGLGHEQFRISHGKRIPWNDATVIKSLLK